MKTTTQTKQHNTTPDEQVVRFRVGQRIEHLLLMLSFTMLVLTGLPQKFHDMPGAGWLVVALGGIETVRFIHRTFAVLFTIEATYHVVYLVLGLVRRRIEPSMVPELKDVLDAWQMLRYSLGLAEKEPAFGRYSYREKFEYWGVALGGLIMIVTGVILWFPTWITRVSPGVFIPAAKEAHGGEALLALLVIVIWHLYGVHLSPMRFPGDVSIFTGRISKKRMMEEHPLEYARLKAKEHGQKPDAHAASRVPGEPLPTGAQIDATEGWEAETEPHPETKN